MATNCPNKLSVVSYNVHGLNQGAPGIKHMIDLFTPDIFLIQEHWLTTDNLTKLHCLSDDYFAYGSSAMDISISSGPLHGRPYGALPLLFTRDALVTLSVLLAQNASRLSHVLIG